MVPRITCVISSSDKFLSEDFLYSFIKEVTKMQPIRTSAKAIIIRDGKILLIKNLDGKGAWYTCPGGRQEKGEDLVAALERKFLEGISCKINIIDIKFVREYFGSSYEFAERDANMQQSDRIYMSEVN